MKLAATAGLISLGGCNSAPRKIHYSLTLDVETPERLRFGGAAPSDLYLTGHLLGGGLAGFIATLTDSHATVFDNMPYCAAIISHDLSANVTLQQISDYLTNGTPVQGGVGLPSPADVTRDFTDAGKNIIYGGTGSDTIVDSLTANDNVLIASERRAA